MSKSIAYSGISAKVKAMEGRLLSRQQYEELAALTSVSETVAYLKNIPAYRDCFQEFDADNVHRGQLERVISNSLYTDFSRLYKFADSRQKQFLKLYFLRFEIAIIKEALCSVFVENRQMPDISQFHDFFTKHARVDIYHLAACTTLNELVEAMKPSRLYPVLFQLSQIPGATLTEYEIALDSFYFTQLWKNRKKYLHHEDFDSITEIYGKKIDLLNLQWIARAKGNLNLTPIQIYSVIIPIQYKLKPQELTAMIEADSPESLMQLIGRSYYGRFITTEQFCSLESVYAHLQQELNHKVSRRYPYSAAILNNYLYQKEAERNRIISIIESIRYGMDNELILAQIH